MNNKQMVVPGTEVEFKQDDDTGFVRAKVATFGVVDRQLDLLANDAIGKQETRISGYGHEVWFGDPYPVGKGYIREVDTKAVFEGNLFMDMEGVPELYKLLKNMGGLQEWSFSLHDIEGYQETFDGVPVRVITKCKVHEVSPVLIGAGIDTGTLAVKRHSIQDMHDAIMRKQINTEAARIFRSVLGVVNE